MRTVIDLPDEHLEPLKALAERLEISRAELVRRAVAEYLQRFPAPADDAAFGLWRHHAEDAVLYQERLRGEWDHG